MEIKMNRLILWVKSFPKRELKAHVTDVPTLRGKQSSVYKVYVDRYVSLSRKWNKSEFDEVFTSYAEASGVAREYNKMFDTLPHLNVASIVELSNYVFKQALETTPYEPWNSKI